MIQFRPRRLLSLSVIIAGWAHAQTAPDAGSLLPQVAPPSARSLPQPPAEQAAKGSTTKPTSSAEVVVRDFRFRGNTLIDSARLGAALAGYLGRSLDFVQLQATTAAVAEVYREAGWIVRAYLPRQEIVDGVVTIEVVEATLGKVTADGQPARMEAARVLAIFTAQQEPGSFLRSDAVDRALLLADDQPGVSVSGALQPGGEAGQTDIALRLADEPLFAGLVFVDNTAPRSTGRERLVGRLDLRSPLRFGDQLTAVALHSEGADYLRLGYSLPVGADGWRIGPVASWFAYELVTPEFKALRAEGSSQSVGVEAQYPVLRSRLKNLYFGGNAERRWFSNEANGTTTTDYRVDTATLSLSGNLFDGLGGGGANSAELALVGGHLDLDGSPNRAADAATTRAAGDFVKLRYALSRQQALSENLSVFASLSGQRASKNLDSAEKFYLGGANGVRAYPNSEAGGSEGDLATLELRWRAARAVSVAAFYDHGVVKVNRDNEFVGAAARNRYSLKGAGISLDWQADHGLGFKAIWARRIGANPGALSNGDDQDGSHVKNRFWLTASLSF